MRSIDLALYADELAAEAATLAARLDRARGTLRRVAIEREARLALEPELVARLERLGVLASGRPGGLGSEIAEIQLALRALEAWVERELAQGVSGASRPTAVGTGAAAAAPGQAGPSRKEPAMSV